MAEGKWSVAHGQILSLPSCGIAQSKNHILKLQDRDPRARLVRGAHGFNPKARGPGLGPEGNEHDLILLGIDDFGECPSKLLESNSVEEALENRELDAATVGLYGFLDAPEPLRMADVVADEESLAIHDLSGW